MKQSTIPLNWQNRMFIIKSIPNDVNVQTIRNLIPECETIIGYSNSDRGVSNYWIAILLLNEDLPQIDYVNYIQKIMNSNGIRSRVDNYRPPNGFAEVDDRYAIPDETILPRKFLREFIKLNLSEENQIELVISEIDKFSNEQIHNLFKNRSMLFKWFESYLKK